MMMMFICSADGCTGGLCVCMCVCVFVYVVPHPLAYVLSWAISHQHKDSQSAWSTQQFLAACDLCNVADLFWPHAGWCVHITLGNNNNTAAILSEWVCFDRRMSDYSWEMQDWVRCWVGSWLLANTVVCRGKRIRAVELFLLESECLVSCHVMAWGSTTSYRHNILFLICILFSSYYLPPCRHRVTVFNSCVFGNLAKCSNIYLF